MKKIALLLFMIFATVQLAPAVKAFFKESISVFIVDEEKMADKDGSSDNKEKKSFTGLYLQSEKFTIKINTAFQLSEKIHPSPCLEKLTPPPNFC